MRTKKSSIRTEADVLGPIREAAALALATGFSEDEAAKKTGTASQIIKTWLRTDSMFVHRISEIRGEISQRVRASVSDKMLTAVATLDEICRDSRDDATRLAAAKLLLEVGMKMQQNVEFEQRITVHQVSQQQNNTLQEPPLVVLSESMQGAQNTK
ncbi:hypothetical protein [Schlesneria sp. T3-172]|uniref:hypothetical protein n=1 Tax=Schlesneria sphaerica TaxID=3373610 RepID=UPI0037C8D2BC